MYTYDGRNKNEKLQHWAMTHQPQDNMVYKEAWWENIVFLRDRIIADMLTIPSTHLVIIAYNDEGNRAINFYNNCGHIDQISLFIGEDIANIKALTSLYLPKSAIDKTSIKMAELIKARITTKDDTPEEKK